MINIDDKIKKLENQLKLAKVEKERQELKNTATIGGRVRKLMYTNNVTITDMASIAGCSVSTLTRMLNGAGPVNHLIIRVVSDYFKVSCDWIIKGEESTEEASSTKEMVLGATIKKFKNKIAELEEELEEWKCRAHDLGYYED